MTVLERSQVRLRERGLPAARILSDRARLFWWVEVAVVAAFYGIYWLLRNSAGHDALQAQANALDLMQVQRALGIGFEQAVQQWALGFQPIIVLCNYFYGSVHFIVTGGVLVYLYRKCTDDYPLWRNTLGITTALALVGFTLWPLMPPRLMPIRYGFVDTLAQYPTFWSFNSGTVRSLSNQFAAMPSVHCAWALWCALALVPRLRRRWAKALAAAYPVMTVIAIVLTGNHFILDAVGGFAVLGLGYLVARAFTRAGRRPAPEETAPATV